MTRPVHTFSVVVSVLPADLYVEQPDDAIRVTVVTLRGYQYEWRVPAPFRRPLLRLIHRRRFPQKSATANRKWEAPS